MNWWDPLVASVAVLALGLSGVTVWFTRMQAHEARRARELAEQRPEVWLVEKWKGGGYVLINRTGKDALEVDVELPKEANTMGRETSFDQIPRGSGEILFAVFDGRPISQPNIVVRWSHRGDPQRHVWWRPLT